jgi:hypothetical protein
MAGQKNGLEIARHKRMGGWVIQEARVLDAHGYLPIHCYKHGVALIGQIRNPKLEIRNKLETRTKPVKIYTETVTRVYWTLGQ